MAGEYTINWTDDQGGANALKLPFVIAPNTVNGPGNVGPNTPLQLPGRFIVNYGEIVAEDMVHLMEHFSSPTPPSPPTSGLIWFNSAEDVAYVRNAANTDWISVSSGGGGGNAHEEAPTGSFTATTGSNYFVDTSLAVVVITLPLSPSVGDTVGFTDVAGTFNTNSLFVDGNSELIMNDPTQMENNVQYSTFRLSYSGASYGWSIVAS